MATKQKRDQLVIGKNSVFELIKSSVKRITKIYCMSIRKIPDNLVSILKTENIKIEVVPTHTLDSLSGSVEHQGIVAVVDERKFYDLSEIIGSTDTGIILVLDSIFDPQNFGTILRVAECFAVRAVVFSKNRGSPLTPAVTKASVGASEIVKLCEVSNLVNAIEKLQKDGYWSIAACIGDNASEINNFRFPEKSLLIMGSEGNGIQPLLLKKADFKVYIPMYGQIDSLNVSQATAVFLHEYRRQVKGIR